MLVFSKNQLTLFFFIRFACQILWVISIFPAQGITLTEQQAIALFYQRNLDIIAGKYAISRAKAEEIIAAAIPNPVLTLESNEIAFRYPGNASPSTYVSIEQLIELGGKRKLRMERSQLGTEAAISDLQDTIRVLSNVVRHQFYSLLLAQKSVAIAQATAEDYQEILQANKLRFKVGDIAKRDLTRIEVEALNAQSDLDSALAHLTQERAELAKILAWPEGADNIKVADQWLKIKEFSYPLDDIELLTQHAFSQRPDIKSAQLRVEQASKNLTLAHRLKIPDITLNAGYTRDFGNIVLESGIVGVSVPLPIFYQHKGEIDKASVELNSLELEIQQIKQKLKTEIISAVAAWNSSTMVMNRYQQDVLNRIDEVQESAEFAYNHGSVDIIDLIEAKRNYKIKMLEYYTTLANRGFAYADLLSALGEESAL
ncbi:TolC family protein [Candidatus Nitrosacidococcus tergens]|uniref:Outer membrane efflux protein n=1 Tax=Candidatus Nitrosacidococcus tergens TaxID=553981 RepID=A0A7G1Q979_9GAMM|nr:TolC family protein [Candidatus Nitrosacidococcus tergens]CAB1275537.1 Outer membrane efflux protein [Candidatus Nitrosacidococcus tergens]